MMVLEYFGSITATDPTSLTTATFSCWVKRTDNWMLVVINAICICIQVCSARYAVLCLVLKTTKLRCIQAIVLLIALIRLTSNAVF
jgi:hypothetical protein